MMLQIKLKGMLILLHTSSLVCLTQSAAEDSVLSDVLLSTPGLARKYGYSVEEHTVQTEDGYLLTHFRIPHGRTNSTTEGKGPVILQHGQLCASDFWILNGQEKSLGFILADAGYDVWLTNIRGNRHSRKHVTLPINSAQFWNFSWHEMGMYDMPATIDYILATTGENRLSYISHSMGANMLLVMASMRPDYNDKLSVGFFLAPPVYLKNPKHPLLHVILPISGLIGRVLTSLGIWELFPYSNKTARIVRTLCPEGALTHQFCVLAYYTVYGEDSPQLNKTLLPVYIPHLLSGVSTKTLLHYSQLIKSGRFQQFDYGTKKNIEYYGQPSPPDYDVKKMTTPISLYYGEGDPFVNPEGVKYLSELLPHLVSINRAPPPKFNHNDPVFAIEAKQIVFDPILNVMKMY
ncbi:lipase 3-like [Periplaneta americana]|uniref:lipase 3-like n=1 Tax=Periplaneta americana TaxID=6978 RepID=UPI0037E8D357